MDAEARRLWPSTSALSRPLAATVQAPRRGFGVGHPLHPILTDVPIGVWTSSILLDWTGGKANQSASDRLILIGLLAAGATAANGWSDWANAEGEHAGVRRSGLVHAAANATAVALMLGSYSARKRGAGARQAAFARRLGRARRGRLAGRTSDLHARRRGHNERTTGSETAARGHLARLSNAPSRRRTQTKRDPAGFCLHERRAASSAAPASVLTSARARPGPGAEATGAAGRRGRTEKPILMPTIDPEPFGTGLALTAPTHAGVRSAT